MSLPGQLLLATKKKFSFWIVPARNEGGDYRKKLSSKFEVGLFTEIIFVEGHSNDNTFEEIQKGG